MTFPFAKEREYFPILNEKIQLSSCSQSALSRQVEEAIAAYMETLRHTGMDWNLWMDKVEEAKGHFARLINASVEEIAVLSSVSDCASSVATALDFSGKRNQIVTTEMDFPSIGHVWLAQQKRGAHIQFIPAAESVIPLEYYSQTVNEQTLITSIPHVSYYNGFKQDVRQIAKIVHEKGSYLFVDAYQSAGSVKIDVKEMDIDFLAAGVQKYMLGIPGIAFLYVKGELAEKLEPVVTGWFGRVNPFAFDIKHLDYAKGARRFETGTPPMVNGYAAAASIGMLGDIGVQRIEAYLQNLSSVAIAYAEEKGLRVMSPLDLNQKAANTAIYIPQASKAEAILKEKGIIVSARNDVIRIAPHFYNTEQEVMAAIDALADLPAGL
ncbi:aminotransferase class V-fold PLP-dependent enzyme [Brevibacillus choshinensis]|uniref:Aminotransferase class V-fold PLP-dependent enzyme n=1 Tax=Brevibacillus choshinensis TaxID=54911 RepID=A0ABX7FJY4_BRECH|nr:aminotransferase class V-fold PLP-dependent enzyme [Brevibacillus choshinensis]QRG66437.1 aminotransferase class V-fold PLP-dependent enzyme [Brevibacillus choshinensis]